jgi:type IX secretion system PorP/SprF family membrane protein
MKIKYTLITLFAVILGNIAFSQYAFNSSVFNQTPSLFNVATTATGGEDMAFCTSFKMQHLTMTGTPLRSNTLVTEFKISDGPMSKNHFGLGINLVNEQTGESKLMSTDIAIPINYSIQMNQFAKLTIGASPGLILQSYDPTLPTWESDWNGSAFNWTYGDPTFINSSLSRSSYASFNVNTGIHYQFTNRNKSKYFGGLAINHINKPKMNFSESSDKMFMQMVANFGADLSTSRRDLRVQPQIMAFKNGPNSNFIMGVMFENILSNGSDITNILKSKSINYGAYYRWKDAISLNLNYKFSNFRLGVAVDVTVSKLSAANKGLGAIELYFKSMHLYGKKKNKIG